MTLTVLYRHHTILVVLGFIMLVLNCCTENQSISTGKTTCKQLPVGTHLPRWTQTPDDLLLSIVSSSPDSEYDTLMLMKPSALQKDVSVTLAYGKDWFVNWADFPSVAYVENSIHGEILFYHFLRYSADGTYDYDIMYNLHDGGGDFYDYKKLHNDTVSAEHGFLSSAALPAGGLQVTWLDGRYTKEAPQPPKGALVGAAAGYDPANGRGAKEGTEEHGHGGGAMTLRTKKLSDSTSVELDRRVCDCCNTATVATDSLIMVAYRDRSEHEIRDIGYVVKRTGSDEWSTPKLVHADNWEISGCPVNGPALAANERGDIAAVWYTAPRGRGSTEPAERAQILFSRYDAATDSWHAPTLLDDENPLGRVDLQLSADGTAYATALTATADAATAALTLWTILKTGKIKREVLATTSPARSSGFPKIALFQGKLFWARTVVGEKKTDHFVEICKKKA